MGLRVLLVGPYPPPHGGVQTHLVSLRRLLVRRGISCAIVNITRHRTSDSDDVYYPQNALELVWRIVRLRPDLIHLHFGGNLTRRLLALTFVCSLLPRTKTVLTFHSGGYPTSAAGLTARPFTLRGFVLRRIDRLVGVNSEIAELFHRFGCSPSRICHIPPHSSEIVTRSDEVIPVFIREFVESHSPTLISVGLLEPEYDLALQVELIGVLRTMHHEAGLLLIGSGTLERELRAHIAAKPFGEHVLLCGDVPHASTLAAMMKSDVVLRTTLHDGDSISVREALLLGVPVVATDNAMRPAGVRLFQVGSLVDLRNAVIDVLREPSRVGFRSPVGVQNIERVLDLYHKLVT